MQDEFYLADYNSPFGNLILASDRKNLVGVWFEGQKYFCQTLAKNRVRYKNTDILRLTKNWLDRYFAGKKPKIHELSLNPFGTEFRKLVWEILCKITYGDVITYGEIAKQIAIILVKEKMSAQAVGSAVAHNPISIIIPCHRVVGANGSFTGYAGGIDRKIKLLQLEKVNMTGFFVP